MSRFQVKTLHGAQIDAYLDDIAKLRIDVFREWPYLYHGSADYEARYLRVYRDSPRSIVVLALVDGVLAGVSTGLPMADESAAFRQPLEQAGLDVARVFYCGESVLRPAFRGMGIGHAFFDAREAHARKLGGFRQSAFAAVNRDMADPRRPADARSNEVFWQKRGYRRHDAITMQLDWDEGQGETGHTLTFWLRELE